MSHSFVPTQTKRNKTLHSIFISFQLCILSPLAAASCANVSLFSVCLFQPLLSKPLFAQWRRNHVHKICITGVNGKFVLQNLFQSASKAMKMKQMIKNSIRRSRRWQAPETEHKMLCTGTYACGLPACHTGIIVNRRAPNKDIR